MKKLVSLLTGLSLLSPQLGIMQVNATSPVTVCTFEGLSPGGRSYAICITQDLLSTESFVLLFSSTPFVLPPNPYDQLRHPEGGSLTAQTWTDPYGPHTTRPRYEADQPGHDGREALITNGTCAYDVHDTGDQGTTLTIHVDLLTQQPTAYIGVHIVYTDPSTGTPGARQHCFMVGIGDKPGVPVVDKFASAPPPERGPSIPLYGDTLYQFSVRIPDNTPIGSIRSLNIALLNQKNKPVPAFYEVSTYDPTTNTLTPFDVTGPGVLRQETRDPRHRYFALDGTVDAPLDYRQKVPVLPGQSVVFTVIADDDAQPAKLFYFLPCKTARAHTDGRAWLDIADGNPRRVTPADGVPAGYLELISNSTHRYNWPD
jgi:hypothetical protein